VRRLSAEAGKEGGKRYLTNLDVAVSLEVKHGKAADIPKSVDVDGELAEKVDDRWCARGQREPEDERRQYDTSELGGKRNRFHRENLAELSVDGLGMQLFAPLVRKVVSVLNNRFHKNFRVKYPVLFGNHATRNCDNTTKEGKVEEDRAVGSNFEVDEKISVDNGGKKKHGSEGARYECRKSGYWIN